MEARFYLRVSGAVFGIICVGHLLRIIFGWKLIIGSLEVPMAVSWLGMIFTGALAGWAAARMPSKVDHLGL